uniref:Uncharacterized protein n=1 Tax=Chromera velia CCMP2878 TaxID=1169474 RepID=A0A0G4HTR4_9ALVE|eukprot:Cvel_8514.t1-p1 / transcript=Cvel_8514.t1 / gene=Cvel_8514 / organism=Chromera_velia_CCMP2878 / gene_product=hypothetical protein / transcript_product=hypothetical protein / location=Cvel_scaffold471:46273-47016(+) / protein_length=167 / sequence_SO=supercontig / SO=protein_coding / is_pseudo=false
MAKGRQQQKEVRDGKRKIAEMKAELEKKEQEGKKLKQLAEEHLCAARWSYFEKDFLAVKDGRKCDAKGVGFKIVRRDRLIVPGVFGEFYSVQMNSRGGIHYRPWLGRLSGHAGSRASTSHDTGSGSDGGPAGRCTGEAAFGDPLQLQGGRLRKDLESISDWMLVPIE